VSKNRYVQLLERFPPRVIRSKAQLVATEAKIESLLALPLSEGNEQIGVLILTQNKNRLWLPSEILVIRTLSDQVLIALNNAGLRRLVKNLSVTDEKSGLLKRASYLDLLQAETRRGLQQGTSVTVLLMKFGRRSTLIKEYGEQAVTAVMEQIGQLFSGNIRSNDLAFRYEATTVALVLGDTGEKEALLAVEKLRRWLKEVRFPGKDTGVGFSAGLAEAAYRAVEAALAKDPARRPRSGRAFAEPLAQALRSAPASIPTPPTGAQWQLSDETRETAPAGRRPFAAQRERAFPFAVLAGGSGGSGGCGSGGGTARLRSTAAA